MNIGNRHRWVSVAAVAIAACANPALAGFTDLDPNTPGVQSGSWTEPRKLWVTIPAGMAGADRMMFEMGVSSWNACLELIQICFRNPTDPAPPAADGMIAVNLVPPGSNPGGDLGSALVLRSNPPTPHGPILSASIDIDTDALGSGNLLKNLGAHEFGHALGLDHLPHPATGRVTVMDPDFDASDPFIAPTDMDKMMLGEHYTLVPTPLSGAMATLALTGLIARRRR